MKEPSQQVHRHSQRCKTLVGERERARKAGEKREGTRSLVGEVGLCCVSPEVAHTYLRVSGGKVKQMLSREWLSRRVAPWWISCDARMCWGPRPHLSVFVSSLRCNIGDYSPRVEKLPG